MKSLFIVALCVFAAFKGYDVLKGDVEQSAVAKTFQSHHERLAAAGEL